METRAIVLGFLVLKKGGKWMAGSVGRANVEITADDRQARKKVNGFLGFLKGSGKIAAGVAGGLALIFWGSECD